MVGAVFCGLEKAMGILRKLLLCLICYLSSTFKACF